MDTSTQQSHLGTTLEALIDQLNATQSDDELQAFYDQYLGKKGLLSQLSSSMKDMAPELKKERGQVLSFVRTALTEAYEAKQTACKLRSINERLEYDIVDLSLQPVALPRGHATLLTQMRRAIEDICQRMGFLIAYGHEVVTKYENFEAVNIPLTHPATDMHDTFYLQQRDSRGEPLVFRTHTSAMQNALMRQYGAPLRVVIPGKVYRYENVDASHDTMFYQLEGMYIDENVSIAHFKKVITDLLSEIFKIPVQIRMRPGYFPFVEPGFEIDATCPLCAGTGCGLCKKTGRIEIMGAGMIHPNVLDMGGVDPTKYTGFAFGIGINRIVAIKYGIKDIRLFTNGDVRFVRSF